MEENKKSYYAIIPANVRYDDSLTANAKLLYGEITALANDKGYCWALNEYFAELYSVSKGTISRWISVLSKAGYIKVEMIYKENSKEIKERRIYIQPIFNNEKTYNQNCEYPISNNDKDNTTSLNTTASNNNIYIGEFEELWKYYPIKKGKRKAFLSYASARKAGTTFEEVKKGITEYNRYIDHNEIEEEYIKYGSTWFYQHCWEDEYEVSTNDNMGADNDEYGEWLDSLERE